MSRKVIITKDIEARLDTLALLAEEVDGLLLYRQRGEYCPIDSLFMTGVGTESEVIGQSGRLDVAKRFLRMNPSYYFIGFHTHSVGSIRMHGDDVARHFSQGDIVRMNMIIAINSRYVEMLVTPETKLLYGIDNPSLVIVQSIPGYQERSAAASIALHRIARELGCNLETLQAHGTRRK